MITEHSRLQVFANLDDNTEYKFSVRANTRKGYGPWSTQSSFRTDRNIVRAPLNVKAMATSDSGVQVWWEAVPLRSQVIGYEVFYSMTAVEDLDQWQRKTVGRTTSIDLLNLERHAQVLQHLYKEWQNISCAILTTEQDIQCSGVQQSGC